MKSILRNVVSIPVIAVLAVAMIGCKPEVSGQPSDVSTVELVKVTGGKITGSAYTDNNPGVFPAGRIVNLSSFYMGKYEVTQAQYKSIMTNQKVTVDGTEYTLADSPSECTGSTSSYKLDYGKDHANYPVDDVTWYDAVYYCNELSKKENLVPYYTINVTKVTLEHIVVATVTVNEGANGYRLPTETEWEYAARGGDTSAADWNYTFSGADKANDSNYTDLKNSGLDSVGWYSYNNITGTTSDSSQTNSYDGYGTHKVGSKINGANRLGIYDMSGNLWEWCYDWYNEGEVGSGEVTDPTGDDSSSDNTRVRRGGSWWNSASYATVSYRYNYEPGAWSTNTGFRVVRSCSN